MGIKSAAFLNLRVAHEIKGCADKVLPFLYEKGRFVSTLILSPPGCGNCAVSPPMMPAGGSSAGCVSRTGRCGSSSPCCCSCRASTASANFDADVDLPVFFSGNGRPQAVPFAFSPGSLPGDFFRAVRSPEKGQKRGGPLKISRARSRFIPLKLLKPEINRIFVR